MESEIRSIIDETLGKELYEDANEIGIDENLFNLGLDSLNIVGLIIAFEDKYNIEFKDDEIASSNWKSIRTIEQLLKSKKIEEK